MRQRAGDGQRRRLVVALSTTFKQQLAQVNDRTLKSRVDFDTIVSIEGP
jgi:hypothetical protein